jgi:hypothetical protein|nr:MAG TPA: hypothetical protein [Caudoviricetes sp.]
MTATDNYFEVLKKIININKELKVELKNTPRSELENMLFQDLEVMKTALSRSGDIEAIKADMLYKETLRNINLKELADKIEEFVKEN